MTRYLRMLHAIILFTCILKCASSSPYRLYEQPSNIIDQFAKDAATKIILPQNQKNLIIFYKKSASYFEFEFCHYSEKSSSRLQRYVRNQSDLIDAFWISKQYLLVVCSSKTILYRPNIYEWEEKQSMMANNYTAKLACTFQMQEQAYLATVSDNNESWIINIQQITYNEPAFLNLIEKKSFIKQSTKEGLTSLTHTKDLICIVVTYYEGLFSKRRIYCYSYQNNITIINSQLIGVIEADQATNNLYYFTTNKPNIYSASFYDDGEVKLSQFQYPKMPNTTIESMKIRNEEIAIILKVTTPLNKTFFYVLIMQKIEGNFFPTQYLSFKVSYNFILHFTKQIDRLAILAVLKEKYMQFGIMYTSHIVSTISQSLLITLFIMFSILFLIILSLTVFRLKVVFHIFILQHRHLNIIFQFLLIAIAHVGVFILTLFTNSQTNANFAYNPNQSATQQSFELWIYQTLFYFTSLVAIVFEGSASFRAKSTYLDSLSKYGLEVRLYFCYRQLLLIFKGTLYSIISITMFYYLKSNCIYSFCLTPSWQQLVAATLTYAICLYSIQNIVQIIAYLCHTYWQFMELALIILFLSSFLAGQFDLNNIYTVSERAVTCLCPLNLFFSNIQKMFQTKIRFNDNDVSSQFLFTLLFLQPSLILTIFWVCFNRLFKAKNLQNIIKISVQKSQKLINQSGQGDNFENGLTEPLLRAFIPCKLSTNQGFEKVSVLRDIRFTANRGEILTFLDCENFSKRTLFDILANNLKSDKHVERDIEGEICYSQNIKLSLVVDDAPFLADLSIIERLQFVSTLRNAIVSVAQRRRGIDFILDEFNIPERFRSMKPRQLSGGYLKKLILACAFVGDPDVVIIDEPTLGLDIRFRHILYRKLKEWKHNKLIILGTSDQAEADAVSDRVLVMQNGRAIDRSSQAGGRLMINLKLSFSQPSDWSRAKDIIKARLKKHHVVQEHDFNQFKHDYRIKLSIINEGKQLERQLPELMKQLNDRFNFSRNTCHMNFSITNHPYDSNSLLPFKVCPSHSLAQLTYNDIKLYQSNKAFDVDSQDEIFQGQEIMNQTYKKAINMLKQLSDIQQYQPKLKAQFKAAIYLYISLWRRKFKYEILLLNIYFWIQYILWLKMDRILTSYDLEVALINYCLLHLSLIDMKTHQIQTLLLEKIPSLLIVTVKWLFDFVYVLANLSFNLFIQFFLTKIIIIESSQEHILQKVSAILLFVACFTLFTSILKDVIKSKRIVIGILLLSHVSFLYANFSSFVEGYTTNEFSFNGILKYCFYPLTVKALFESLLSKQDCWIYIAIMSLQVGLLFLLKGLLHNQLQKKKRKLPRDYINIDSQIINDERILVQNITDKTQIPIVCDNIVHFYTKEPVLRNFYMQVKLGEVIGMFGHNGCGKTTTLDIIAGKILSSSGSVQLFGKEVEKASHLVGYCPQQGLLWDELTVEQNIRVAGGFLGLTDKFITIFMVKLLRYFRLRGLEQVRAQYLSVTQKKKVSLAIVILGFPKILLFDEVTGNVDPEGRRRINYLIKSYTTQLGRTVLISSHDVAEAEAFCDRVNVLKQGALRKTGTLFDLCSEQQHEFYLITFTFAQGNHEALLQRQKMRVKQYIYGLQFIRIEHEERLMLAYSIDIKKVSIIDVWRKVYDHFFIESTIEKFSLGRHGLAEIVKYSIAGDEGPNNEGSGDNNRRAQGSLEEVLI